MYSSKALKTLFLTSAALVSEDKMSCKECKPSMCRPSELPIYTPEPTAPVRKESENVGVVAGALENVFATVRKQYTTVYNEIKAYERVGQDYVEQSKENLDWLLDYLRQEDNTTPKAGAIAIGGLAGLILGLRGGLFKKTVYATTGALSMAAVCYPQEAAEYSQIALGEAKKYATIAYNFAYGEPNAEEQVMLSAIGGEESSILDDGDAAAANNPEVGLGIITKAHEKSSESCDCPVGPCLGPHDETLNNSSSSSSSSRDCTECVDK